MVLWLLQEWSRGPSSGQDAAGLLGTTATSQRTPACGLQAGLGALPQDKESCVPPPGAGVSAARDEGWKLRPRSQCFLGVPCWSCQTARPGPKAFFLDEAAAAPHWAWALGGTPHFSPGRFLWVFSAARAGPSLQHVSTCSPGGKGCRSGLGTHSGLAMSDPSTWAVRAGH